MDNKKKKRNPKSMRYSLGNCSRRRCSNKCPATNCVQNINEKIMKIMKNYSIFCPMKKKEKTLH